MPSLRNLIFPLIALHLSTYAQKFEPIFKKDYSHRLEARNTLIAFVGEKISWEQLPYRRGSMYLQFNAKYKIIQMVYGQYKEDTISFVASDHYGVPSFLYYDNVLLYVSKSNGKYYHETYIFNDVYKTKNGRWAGPYPRSYGRLEQSDIRPERIEFADRISFPTTIKSSDGMIRCIAYVYTQPYFTHESDSAIAEYGNYIEELFLREKEGVLTARDLFGDSTYDERHGKIPEIELEPFPDDAQIATFEPYAQSFIDDLINGNFEKIKSKLPDTIRNCDSLLSRDDFMLTNEHRLFNLDFIKEVQTGARKGTSGLRIFLSSTKLNIIKFSIELQFTEEKINEFKLTSYEDFYDPNCNQDPYNPADSFSEVDYMMMGK